MRRRSFGRSPAGAKNFSARGALQWYKKAVSSGGQGKKPNAARRCLLFPRKNNPFFSKEQGRAAFGRIVLKMGLFSQIVYGKTKPAVIRRGRRLWHGRDTSSKSGGVAG